MIKAIEITDPQPLFEAVARFGIEAQTTMAIEEMSELIKEICKLKRFGESFVDLFGMNKISEEMADVYIMLYQMLVIFGNTPEVQKQVDYKTERLRKRLQINVAD